MSPAFADAGGRAGRLGPELGPTAIGPLHGEHVGLRAGGRGLPAAGVLDEAPRAGPPRGLARGAALRLLPRRAASLAGRGPCRQVRSAPDGLPAEGSRPLRPAGADEAILTDSEPVRNRTVPLAFRGTVPFSFPAWAHVRPAGLMLSRSKEP